VTDRIDLRINPPAEHRETLSAFESYICEETLAESLSIVDEPAAGHEIEIDGQHTRIQINT
jgi:hypothetical protein